MTDVRERALCVRHCSPCASCSWCLARYRRRMPWRRLRRKAFCGWRCTARSRRSGIAARGIDVDLAKALAAKLGLKLDVAAFDAGEEVSDDLRNMVWKGHYLGGGAGDVMLHVPLDATLAEKNPQVRFVGGQGTNRSLINQTLAALANAETNLFQSHFWHTQSDLVTICASSCSPTSVARQWMSRMHAFRRDRGDHPA